MTKKLILGIIAFGSLWGALECSVGDLLHDYDLSAVMVASAIFLMAVTRYKYQQPGMQLGMAIVAATMRHFNPIGGSCLICASIAIFAQGVLFEFFWLIPWHKYQSSTMRYSAGIVTFYSIAAISYLITQILTPLLTASFHLSDLGGVLPHIFAHGLIAGIMGFVLLSVVYASADFTIRDKTYYPTTMILTAVCWISVMAGI